jgi:SAM-dependent methyltransferase
MTRAPVDFDRARRRSRLEARLLDAVAGRVHLQHGHRKSDVISGLTGTIVEIGPGTGVNMRYYAPGVHVIGVEPNPAMHERLADQARRHGVDLEIRTVRGERIDVPDGSADAVVGTLVLCGVDDPHQVVSEVHRVLKPGGTFFFLEHVAAPHASLTRRIQALVKRPHRWLFNGCEVDRDTAAVLTEAGFSHVEIDAVDTGATGLYARHQIIGTAVR